MGSEGDKCSNSSGVELLRWKIALTVIMLLFQVARVTLSFTSATPAGAAGPPVSHKAAHCQVSEQGKQATGELVGSPAAGAVLRELSSPELLIPITSAWVGTQSQLGGGGGGWHLGSTLVGQALCQALYMNELL